MDHLLNLKEEVINKRTGSHRIRLEDREKLEEQLKKLRDNNLLYENDMSYTYTIEDEYISFILYRPIKILTDMEE